MLRKGIHIVLIILLLVSTSGLAINRHFCGDKMVAAKLFEKHDESKCCGTETDNCCDDEVISVASVKTEIPLCQHLKPSIHFTYLSVGIFHGITGDKSTDFSFSFHTLLTLPPPDNIQSLTGNFRL